MYISGIAWKGPMAFGLAALRRWRALLAHALLFAFMFRALIPVGYMPDAHALSDGKLNIVICHGDGDSTTVPFDAGPAKQSKKAHASEPCAFAGFHTTFEPNLGIAIARSGFGVASRIKFNPQAVLPPVRAGPTLGSRGPPTIV